MKCFRSRIEAQKVYREIMLLLELNGHANIVEIVDVVKARNDRDIYIVMEFVDGGDLLAVVLRLLTHCASPAKTPASRISDASA